MTPHELARGDWVEVKTLYCPTFWEKLLNFLRIKTYPKYTTEMRRVDKVNFSHSTFTLG